MCHSLISWFPFQIQRGAGHLSWGRAQAARLGGFSPAARQTSRARMTASSWIGWPLNSVDGGHAAKSTAWRSRFTPARPSPSATTPRGSLSPQMAAATAAPATAGTAPQPGAGTPGSTGTPSVTADLHRTRRGGCCVLRSATSSSRAPLETHQWSTARRVREQSWISGIWALA